MITLRPSNIEIPEEIKNTLKEVLSDISEYEPHEIDSIIRRASHLTSCEAYLLHNFENDHISYKNDEYDMYRLVNALSSQSLQEYSNVKFDDVFSRSILWNNVKNVDKRIKKISELMGVTSLENIDNENLQAIAIMATMSTSDFNKRRKIIQERFSLETLSQAVTPHDLLHLMENPHSIYGIRNKKNKDTLFTSKKFSDTLELDMYASRMLENGDSYDDVVAYHHQVPNGYWNDVNNLLEDEEFNGNLRLIYSYLENDFGGFHPRQRTRKEG